MTTLAQQIHALAARVMAGEAVTSLEFLVIADAVSHMEECLNEFVEISMPAFGENVIQFKGKK